MPVINLRVLSTVCVLQLFDMGLFSQGTVLDKKITLDISSISVREFIDTLSILCQTGFTYDAGAIPLDSVISVKEDSISIKHLLYQSIHTRAIDVSFFMDQVVISHSHELPDQNNPSIKIYGTVKDFDHGTPLSLVNISLIDEPLGTITNDQGSFEFILNKQYVGANVMVSALGYKRFLFHVPECDSLISIYLSPSDYQLPEVQIRAISTDNILFNIIQQQAENYFDSPVALSGFFREAIRQDQKYVQITEAAVEVFKPSYQQNDIFEKVRIIKGRKRTDVEKMAHVQFRMQGGPFYFSRLDIARYLDFLPPKDAPSAYRFHFEGNDYAYGRTMLKLAFEPYTDTGDLLYQGTFLVDAESFAIVSVSFEMTPNTIRQSRNYLIKKDSKDLKARPYYARYTIDYRPFKEKWILNHTRGELKIRLIDKKNHIRSDFDVVTEMLITGFRPVDGERIKNSQLFHPNNILFDEIRDVDPEFWNHYNIIPPDEDMTKMFRNIEDP